METLQKIVKLIHDLPDGSPGEVQQFAMKVLRTALSDKDFTDPPPEKFKFGWERVIWTEVFGDKIKVETADGTEDKPSPPDVTPPEDPSDHVPEEEG